MRVFNAYNKEVDHKVNFMIKILAITRRCHKKNLGSFY